MPDRWGRDLIVVEWIGARHGRPPCLKESNSHHHYYAPAGLMLSLAPRLLGYPPVAASAIQFVPVPDLFDRLRNRFDEDKRTGEPRQHNWFSSAYSSHV